MDKKIFIRKAKNFIPYCIGRIALSYKWFLAGIAKHSCLGIMFPKLIPFLWKCIGCNIGKDVCFGSDVYLDVDYANQITIEDDVWIASKSIIFAHRRVMDNYYKYGRYKECPQKMRPVIIKKGACISIGAMIMPGVTVGEGAVVGAGALVTKDVPAWSLVAGVPAKVIRFLDDQPNN